MKKIILTIVAFLLLVSYCTAGNWDWGRPMPPMPTPGMAAPPVYYQPHLSTFGYPAPWYNAPQYYNPRPFSFPVPSMYYIIGGGGVYYVKPI